jgi:translation initiation factor IF-2
LKIRIFALARELGLDSKVLLGLADEAGVKLRNALATISQEERDQIVAFVNGSGTATQPAPKAEDLAPTREKHAGKVRDIKHIPGKVALEDPQETASAADVVEDPEVIPEIVTSTDDGPSAEASGTETLEVSETADEETAEEAAVTEAAVTEAAVTEAAVTEAAVTEAAVTVAAVTVAEVDKLSKPVETPVAAPQKPTSPMQRMQRSAPREMKPIGSIKDRDDGDTPREKEREKPAARQAGRPLVASAPTFQPPVAKQKPKKDNEKAMKPVISLDSIVDTKSPLAEQLKQLKNARDEHDGVKGPSGRRGPKTGSLIDGLRRAREEQRSQKKIRRRKRSSNVALKTTAQISFPITVRNLSEAIGRPAKSIIGYFFKSGRMVTINDELVEDEALDVSMELGVDLEIKRGRDVEVELLESLDHEDDEDTLEWRPPIVTILGHVDHGKTTLVDKLRLANVAAGEAGGITQHIAAYQIERNGQAVTFVDTPGHAAFGGMRARGANVTDIIVLVIAVNDGVMPQTVECISHAKNAGVPIIIALNKMDLPGVDDQRVLQQLAQHELLPSEWGGEYEVIRTSGETGLGLDDLIETIQLTAELHNYQTNPDREALGVCLESFRDEGRGIIAWMIVQKGTLRVGDNILCGTSYGRVRAIYNDSGDEISEAGPSMPVKVTGLNEVPTSGVHFFAMKDIEDARGVAETRIHEGREETLSRKGKPKTIVDILASGREGEGPQTLPVIMKADSPGSLEAIRGELDKFDHAEVMVKIIHEGVGGVNESDVYLASAAGAVIIAFHVVAEDRAAILADNEGVEVKRYSIIYEITEHIRQSLEGMLRPERVEVATGRAIVLQTFSISRFGTIAGCRILNGTIARDNRVHVIRDNTVINNYRLASLKREKDDAKEVRDGMECGIRLDGFNDIKEGDILEAFRVDEIQRKLE